MTDDNEKSELEAHMMSELEDFLKTNKIDGIKFKPGKINVNMNAVKKIRQIDEADAVTEAINETMANSIDHKPINENNTVTINNAITTPVTLNEPDNSKNNPTVDKTETDSVHSDTTITNTSTKSTSNSKSSISNDESTVNTSPDPTSDTIDKIDDNASKPGEDDHTGKPNVWRQFFFSWRGIVAAVIIIVAMLIPVIWFEFIKPSIDRRQIAQQYSVSTAPIIPYAHKWEQVKLDASKMGKLSVNTKQWLLQNNDKVNGVRTSCMVFHAKDRPETGHLAKVTLAFGDSKSRDLMNAQASTFETAMRQGKIDLQVCMLLTNDEYSAFALETLGEVDFNDYTNTWTALKNLLKVDESSFTDSNSRINTALKAIDNIPDVDKKVNISSDSIKNGSFIQWSKVMTDANTVEKIPAFWLDGVNLSNQDKFSMYNPDAMWAKLNTLD